MGLGDVCADFLNNDGPTKVRVKQLREQILSYDYDYVPGLRQLIADMCDLYLRSTKAAELDAAQIVCQRLCRLAMTADEYSWVPPGESFAAANKEAERWLKLVMEDCRQLL